MYSHRILDFATDYLKDQKEGIDITRTINIKCTTYIFYYFPRSYFPTSMLLNSRHPRLYSSAPSSHHACPRANQFSVTKKMYPVNYAPFTLSAKEEDDEVPNHEKICCLYSQYRSQTNLGSTRMVNRGINKTTRLATEVNPSTCTRLKTKRSKVSASTSLES